MYLTQLLMLYICLQTGVDQNIQCPENNEPWFPKLLPGTWSYGPGLQPIPYRLLHSDRYDQFLSYIAVARLHALNARDSLLPVVFNNRLSHVKLLR